MSLIVIKKARVFRSGFFCRFRVNRFIHHRNWIRKYKFRRKVLKKRWDGRLGGRVRYRYGLRAY